MIASEEDASLQGGRRPSILRHSEIEMLHDLLLEWCSDHNVNPDTADAREVADELADLFDIGVRDHATLREAIASR